jgi:hypothetical protein
MAYSRMYPQNITPGGTSRWQGFENDDKEIKRIYGLLDDVGELMLSGTKRQCVLYGSTDSSGNPNFLTASGLNVSINGSSKPVILSFANGFSTTSGTLDTLDAITSAVSSAWTIPANSTYYLYIEKDMSTGLLSYGRTANEDTYSKAAPSSPVLDQCYFNTNEMKMYRYNGSAWEQKWRIFVAKAVSTNSAVTLTQYPMESKAFIRDNLNVGTNLNVGNNLNVGTINGTLVSSLSPHTLKRSIAYAVGDVAYSSNLPSWAYLECTTAGTTASTEPTLSSVTVGASITDGTVKWIVGDARIFGVIAANPNFYNRDALFTTAKTTITTPSTLMVNINNVGYALRSAQTINLALAASWDSNSSTYATAANRAGKDFYIYACVPTSGTVPVIILSVNSTVPTGHTSTNSRKIGGFHCLCADAGTNISDHDNTHPLSGYMAGDILPASVWDLIHRPVSEPEGMVYIDGLDIWVDIYLSSWTGSYSSAPENLKLVSKYGALAADGTSAEKFHCWKFEQVFGRQKKRLLFQREFMVASVGSNQSTSVKGGADVNTTGGFVDTAGRRMISNYGIEDCCGNLWQWGADVGSATTDTSSYGNAFDANDKYIAGQTYGTVYRPLLGASALSVGACGSRASFWVEGALFLDFSCGGRGASEPRKGVM